MSEATNPNGGPAFPADAESHNRSNGQLDGMTLRDYFAAKALPQMLSLEDTQVWNQSLGGERKRDHALQVAKAAYFMADAMLKARAA